MDKERLAELYLPAAQEALGHFGVKAEEVSLAALSENVTFRVTVKGAETPYSLRLHRPGYNSLEELESERAWVEALRRAGIFVQRGLLTREGHHFQLIDIPAASEQRYAGMTTWLEGTPLKHVMQAGATPAARADYFRQIGELAATLHNQSESWQPPRGFTRRRLDLDGLLGERPRWGRFWKHDRLDEAEASLLLGARDALGARLDDYGVLPTRFGLIHADLHPQNLIFDGSRLALIDFDDCAWGWHLYDLATALLDDAWQPGFPTLRTALLEGYRRLHPLPGEDEAMLSDFLLIRGLAVIGWYRQRPELPASDYFGHLKQWVIAECRTRTWAAV